VLRKLACCGLPATSIAGPGTGHPGWCSKGDARYRELSARFLAITSTMGADLSKADIRKTTEIVRRLSDETKGRSEQLPRSIRLAASAKREQ
jgi:hypothetical protein